MAPRRPGLNGLFFQKAAQPRAGHFFRDLPGRDDGAFHQKVAGDDDGLTAGAELGGGGMAPDGGDEMGGGMFGAGTGKKPSKKPSKLGQMLDSVKAAAAAAKTESLPELMNPNEGEKDTRKPVDPYASKAKASAPAGPSALEQDGFNASNRTKGYKSSQTPLQQAGFNASNEHNKSGPAPAKSLSEGGFNPENRSQGGVAASSPPAAAKPSPAATAAKASPTSTPSSPAARSQNPQAATGITDVLRRAVGKSSPKPAGSNLQFAAPPKAKGGGLSNTTASRAFGTVADLQKESAAAPSDWEADMGIASTGFHRPTHEQPEALEDGGDRFTSTLAKPPLAGSEPDIRHGLREGGSLSFPATASGQLGKHASPRFLGTIFAKNAIDFDEAKDYAGDRLGELKDSLSTGASELGESADSGLKSITRSPMGAGIAALVGAKMLGHGAKGVGRGAKRLFGHKPTPPPSMLGGVRRFLSGPK